MKYVFLLLIIICISFRQSFSQLPCHYGIYAGYGYSYYNINPDFEDVVDYLPQSNFSIGAISGINLKSNVFLEVGLHYYKDGYSIKYSWNVMDPNDPAIPERTNFQASYLQMPLITGYIFHPLKKISFSPNLGLNLRYILTSNEESQFMDGSMRKSDFMLRDIKNLNTGIKFGVRVGYEASPKIVFGLEPYIIKNLTRIDQLFLESGQFSLGISFILTLKHNLINQSSKCHWHS